MRRHRVPYVLVAIAVAGLTVGHAGVGAATTPAPAPEKSPERSPAANGRLDVEIVSSAADQVTGGDARLHVNVPPSMPPGDIAVLVNGADQRDHFSLVPGTRTLSGVVDGLVDGSNTVEVRRNNPGKGVPPHQRLRLTNHPITGPVFSGPHQYPFVCNTVAQGLGQPFADDPVTGTRVFDAGGAAVGLSRNCSAETRVDFRYLAPNGAWVEHTPGVLPPADAATITDADGDEVPLVVRWERGTVNRFLYSIATPVPYDAEAWDLETDVTECIRGWRGLSPLALNPLFGQAPNAANFVPLSAIAQIEWTHFSDIVNIVGEGDDGFARNYWDNVGVQYGLRSVADGSITPEEFLKLNGSVGGWKNEPDMVQEGFPFFPGAPPTDFDPWSRRNQVFSTDPLGSPAPRNQGDVDAMRAVYEAGLVFRGDIDIPILDVRPYLERVLDMHNSHQSFASRQRMLNADGDASNQVIWSIDADPASSPPFLDITPQALDLVDEWMRNIAAHPKRTVAANAPAGAVDRCFEPDGTDIAAGPGVWAGILDDQPPGACTERLPIFSTTRQVAGGPIEQSYFKCALIGVGDAIDRGFYRQWAPSADQRTTLERIFPTGVCDYSQPDEGLPPGWD